MVCGITFNGTVYFDQMSQPKLNVYHDANWLRGWVVGVGGVELT